MQSPCGGEGAILTSSEVEAVVGGPLVSIAMSVRNNAGTLAVAIQSLLDQSYQNWELLLIDDGSTDETVRIARGFVDERIKISADGRPLGLPRRLNQAIELSQGTFFARMDGDDVAYPRRLERQIAYLQRHPEVDLVGSWAVVFGAGGSVRSKRTDPEGHEAICARPIAGFPMIHPTFLGRAEFFHHYRYRPAAVRCEDQDLLLRSYRFSRFANVPEILLGYRLSKIDLKKFLLTRVFLSRALFREFRRQGRSSTAIRAVIEQGLKGCVDIATSSFNYKLLGRNFRYRMHPHSEADRREWVRVWASVNRAGARERLTS